MSTAPTSPPPAPALPLLYIALHHNPTSDTSTDDTSASSTSTDSIHWAFLAAPTPAPTAPSHLYTHTPTPPTTPLLARLLIAEIASPTLLAALLSDRAPAGATSAEWMRAALGRLDGCLGARMGCFESVEAEGRQFGQGVLRGVYGAKEGEKVPTRVLFDWRGGVGVGGEEEGEMKKGAGVEAAGMEMGMESEAGSETDQGVRARLDVLCEDGSFGPGREGGRGEGEGKGADVDVFSEFTNVGEESGHER